jgi:prepilin-type N-terminal cleavage/methylation domain-containing protein
MDGNLGHDSSTTTLFNSALRRGFTLIELAFVLVIIGLIISVGAVLLPMLVNQSKFKQIQIFVNDAKASIIGYVVATGKFPYASTNVNGVATNGQWTGYLPWATLGIPGNDVYMNTMVYAVESHLTTTTSATIKTTLTGLINNAPQPDLSCNPGGSLKVAFVVLSKGENRQLDAPDSMTGNLFSDPSAAPTPVNDDILAVEPLTKLMTDLQSTWQ